ncbi:putative alpha/beta hydrolase [Mycolicibacterium sp. Dal123E01]|uniref:putative alpha/beta hydrolase n=1 Tax=Mycolicibacterium sp. Dal123E01 TaxID=3457578 RepID=UPI00403E898C
MAEYPSLRHISVDALVAGAGGDPWRTDSTLQSGEPKQIADLATAFYNAGVCMTETSEAFAHARSRFEASWNRENGSHPINDSAEVQGANISLRLDKQQLTKIGVALEEVAASLTEAQRASRNAIAALDASLKEIDDAIDRALAQGAELTDADLEPLENIAILDTREALGHIEISRESYTGDLTRAMAEMGAEGYTPDAIDAVDGDGLDASADARSTASTYGASQRDADQALVDSDGPMTAEKAEAAARLGDYETVTTSASSPEAVRLAAERLDDYVKSTQPGLGRPDPVLGVPPSRRALVRREWQKQLEHGQPWMPPMTPDEATRWMDQQEADARLHAINATQKALEDSGMPKQRAESVVEAMASGLTWQDLQKYADVTGDAATDIDGRVPVGRHALDGFNPETIKTIAKAGSHVKGAGSILEIGLAVDAWLNGAPADETLAGLGGSLLGGAGGGIALGFLGGWALGPGGAFVGTMVGGLAGGAVGEQTSRWAVREMKYG